MLDCRQTLSKYCQWFIHYGLLNTLKEEPLGMGEGVNQIMCKQSAVQENIAGFFENAVHHMLFITTVEGLEVFQ